MTHRWFVARGLCSRYTHGHVVAVRRAAALLGLLSLVPMSASRAQQVVTEDHATPMDTSVLSRRVTVHVTDMPLRDAVVAVGHAAHVRIIFQTEVIDAISRAVSLQATNIPLGRAFAQLLGGTRLTAVAVRRDIVSIELGGTGERRALGGITGVVVDTGAKHPVSGVVVSLEGTKRDARTDDRGTFRFADVPAGTYRLTARRLGYRVARATVIVRDDSASAITIPVSSAPALHNDVVTTATGERRRMEVGNAIATIPVDSIVPTTLVRNMSDLLQARVPGVIVSNTSGAVGAPSKIRLRGVNSLALNNDPIIILDGVRLNAQTTVASNQTNVGSQQELPAIMQPGQGAPTPPLAPSRLDDIDPNTIESIDILRGPSASSLYGTDAANGVIVIKTKKGVVGRWRATLSGDAQTSDIPGGFPDQWFGWGHSQLGPTSSCTLVQVAGGSCTQDSVTHFNAQNVAAFRTIGTGSGRTLSGTLSGGTQQFQQFFSLRGANTVGMAKMANAQARVIADLWSGPPPSWMTHPNTEQDVDGSSNTTFEITPALRGTLNASAMYRNVLNGVSGVPITGPTVDTLSYLPSEGQRTKQTTNSKRGLLSLNSTYQPLSWMTFNGTVGGDYTLRTDDALLRAQDCTQALLVGAQVCASGHNNRRGETSVATVNVGAVLPFAPTSWLTLRTALGEQYAHTSFYSLGVGSNCNLAFGTNLLTPAPVCTVSTQQQYSVTENRDDAATAGWYAEETVGLFGMYNTFGLRQDVASAFGSQTNKTPPNYPKLDISFPISERDFFPKQPWISSLQLRLAYGQSGNQASQSGVVNNYTAQQFLLGSTTVNGASLVHLGNAELKPERTTEWEGGFDASFFPGDRLQAKVTLYRKFTRDAITSVSLPSSYGVDVLSEFVNVGNVENRGVELWFSAKLIDRRAVDWDVTVSYSRNTNTLVHKATSLSAIGPLQTQFHEGYPVFGFWGSPVQSYDDLDGNGLLSKSEMTFGAKSYMGAPYPKGEATYSSSLSLLNGAVRVSGNVDQVIGLTNNFFSNATFFPRGAIDPTAPLGQQAAWIQASLNNGYFLETSTVRLNELSLTYTLPATFARRLLHVQSFSATLAGRNLALWSNYVGKDPNVDTSGQFGEVTRDNGTGIPQPRNLALRFNLGL